MIRASIVSLALLALADMYILRPTDASRANGKAFAGVVRGSVWDQSIAIRSSAAR